MHETTDIEEIIEDLRSKNFKIIKVVNLLGKPDEKKKRKKLPLHQLSFEHSEDNKRIFDIKFIAHQKVEIKNIKINPLRVPQCFRCQGWMHTQAYCNKPPKCVKCSGEHLTNLCTQGKYLETVRCINCGGEHTANYSGCEVAKYYREKRANEINNKTQKNSQPSAGNSNNKKSKQTQNNSTYAQIVKETDKNSTQLEMLDKILNKIISIKARLSTLESAVYGGTSE